MTKTQQTQIEKMKNQLSSAYQEQAVNSVLEDVNAYTNPEQFADAVCETYRDILRGAGYGDITGSYSVYRGFRIYGDETELNSVALVVYRIAKNHKPRQRTLNQIEQALAKVENESTCDSVCLAYYTAKGVKEELTHITPKNPKQSAKIDELTDRCDSLISWANYWGDRIA